ncbi:putative diacylglycerol kinase (ATP) [Rosa chinensis]|uniref:Putative diacylglycerol kinase (ATP) n=1 Tax=Rosa chinensis TaxID=74649 RepID=A0A2P6RV98_ROSCH|nr:putative diacylglycerol kinase (ATP) [Rosa chinensis]
MINWHLLMRMKIPKGGQLDPIAPLELPHSLHAFGRVSDTNELNMEGFHTFRGGFWNYFSMGTYASLCRSFGPWFLFLSGRKDLLEQGVMWVPHAY